MEKYIWALPVIFIFHDMEEIIGFGPWLRRNREQLEKRFPFILRVFRGFSTEGFALAVFEELALCAALSALALYTGSGMIRCIWLGAFIVLALHFIMHMGQAAVMRGYVPALATSLLCLPPSAVIILRCLPEIAAGCGHPYVFMAIGGIAAAANLPLAHMLMRRFTKKMGIKADN